MCFNLITVEIGGVLERIIRPFGKEAKKLDFDEEIDSIISHASAWVVDSLAKPTAALESQPFLLTPQEIDTIQTSLIEAKSDKILKDKKYQKQQKQEIGAKLNNRFAQKYDEILQRLIDRNELGTNSQIQETLGGFLKTLKSLAPKFVYQKSSLDELISICYTIRKKRPVVLAMKPAKFNN